MTESSFLNPAAAVRAAKIHEGMEVADFGSAGGFFTRAAARAVGEHSKVWAVDSNRELLSRVKSLSLAEGLSNIEVVHGNIDAEGGSNLPPESMDFVILANALFISEKKEGVVREARRVLKRAGRALVIDWSGSYGGLGPAPEHVVSAAAAQKLFEAEGFEYEERVAAGAYHWGFVVRKKARKSAQ